MLRFRRCPCRKVHLWDDGARELQILLHRARAVHRDELLELVVPAEIRRHAHRERQDGWKSHGNQRVVVRNMEEILWENQGRDRRAVVHRRRVGKSLQRIGALLRLECLLGPFNLGDHDQLR